MRNLQLTLFLINANNYKLLDSNVANTTYLPCCYMIFYLAYFLLPTAKALDTKGGSFYYIYL